MSVPFRGSLLAAGRLAACALLVVAQPVAWVSTAEAEVAFDWSRVGYPNNPPDDEVMICCDEMIGATGFGSVDHVFDMATTEVTNAQYAEFLNAADPTGVNPYSIFPEEMETEPWGGINFVPGNPDGSKYVVDAGAEDWAAIPVTFWGAVRFANWMHNGQGNGSIQDGAYTLEGGAYPTNAHTVGRNPDARYFLPTEDEWYKAAYYDGVAGTYYDYPGSNTQTVCGVPPGPGANCDFSVGEPSDVGSFQPGLYGIYDMDGNALEWSETLGVLIGEREARGGSWPKGVDFNQSNFSYSGLHTTAQEPGVGMRLARPWGCPVSGGSPLDSDGDGVPDCEDNCILEKNAAQDDTDQDQCGNVCDTDYDQSGVSGFSDWGAALDAFGGFDLNMDHTEPVAGPVGFADFGVVRNRFGTQPGPSGTTTGTPACP